MLAAGSEDRLRALLKDLQLVDVLRRYPAPWKPGGPGRRAASAGAAPVFDRLEPAAVGEEAHLTVAVVDYERDGERRLGAASGHLASLTDDAATVRVFVEPNERFRLPDDLSRDVIMIGPGTGVAPFRGFLQEREAQGATGRNWLVFGARHSTSEFLYQVEWQDAARKGLLHRVDLAFSRDPRRARLRAAPAARGTARSCSPGSRAARTCTSAATPSAWRPTSMPRWSTMVAEHGGLDRDARRGIHAPAADERPLPAGRVLR